ncbi:MAG: hypothetical protein CVU34_03620 [Betaproteobacteria bacterium HGW-Betaproteobacteria-7]|jgi:hypothetical protein|nr:MAG: hypothetical protein CVU34_03620 [Betaproteobacteria bacterium HGW-Betaproteobacteria-7]
MSTPKNNDTQSAIREAIRAKRERKSGVEEDIAALEASLIADIETFDLDAAERRARREQSANSGAGMSDSALVFPEIVPSSAPHRPSASSPTPTATTAAPKASEGNLLDQLRHQAELRQREAHSALAERNTTNEAIDQALKHLFFYLHEFVQQLNILKPAISRQYLLVDQHVLGSLTWQEGFADYRTQSQSAGALVELVSFSYRLIGAALPPIERDGPSVERFRTTLFDFGLPFTCKEFKNERSYVERAEFHITSEVSVSARWRADFAKGTLILESRNLERLGSTVYTVRPQAVDQALLEEFGRLVLSQPNHFRDLARR